MDLVVWLHREFLQIACSRTARSLQLYSVIVLPKITFEDDRLRYCTEDRKKHLTIIFHCVELINRIETKLKILFTILSFLFCFLFYNCREPRMHVQIA